MRHSYTPLAILTALVVLVAVVLWVAADEAGGETPPTADRQHEAVSGEADLASRESGLAGESVTASPASPAVARAAGPTREVGSFSRDGACRTRNCRALWVRMADCESGDGDGQPPYYASWAYDGYHDGGLQFLPSTWNTAKRLSEVWGFAAGYGYAYHAPAWVQIRVADNWRRHTSWAQWPTCSRKLGLR